LQRRNTRQADTTGRCVGLDVRVRRGKEGRWAEMSHVESCIKIRYRKEVKSMRLASKTGLGSV
jgi:head-tail adaptor